MFDGINKSTFTILRTRTPQGDGNSSGTRRDLLRRNSLRTRTPQGVGNSALPQDAACRGILRTRTPQGDGNPLEIEVVPPSKYQRGNMSWNGTETPLR